MVRLATEKDLPEVERIYDEIHTAEEAGKAVIGWSRDIYPVAKTAQDALARGDLFVQEGEGHIVGTGIINQTQVDIYAEAKWLYPAADHEVMVLHTLVISPQAAGKGYGKRFVKFYEDYALTHGCPVLRIDTNARNQAARHLYAKLRYREADILPCTFNGLEGVQLVLLEKKLSPAAEGE